MQGIELIQQAVLKLLRHPWALLRVCLLPGLVLGLALSGGYAILGGNAPGADGAGGPVWGLIKRLVLVLSIYVGAGACVWMMIGWHRFLILGERPGLAPRLLPGRILAYVGALIVIGAILVIPGFVVLLVVTHILLPLLAQGDPTIGLWVMIGFKALGLTLVLAFSPILPAIATGRPLRLGQGFMATADDVGALFIAALSLILLDQAVSGLLALGPDNWLAARWIGFAVSGGLLAVVISLVTVIYQRFAASDAAG